MKVKYKILIAQIIIKIKNRHLTFLGKKDKKLANEFTVSIIDVNQQLANTENLQIRMKLHDYFGVKMVNGKISMPQIVMNKVKVVKRVTENPSKGLTHHRSSHLIQKTGKDTFIA